jgi:hypothetical protein
VYLIGQQSPLFAAVARFGIQRAIGIGGQLEPLEQAHTKLQVGIAAGIGM